MSTKPVAIMSSGMVTGVGLNSPSTCAAIRCAIDNFSETRFIDKGGEWIIGSQVPLDQPWRGLPKLVHMAVLAIRECLAHVGKVKPEEIPLLLCVAEKERPGRLEGLDDELFAEIQKELGVKFHPRSTVIPGGRIAGGFALEVARDLIQNENVALCIIAGVDTFLVGATLAAYEDKARLLTSRNSNGFVPGEGGSAILVGLPRPNGMLNNESELLCLGIGKGQEKATIESEEPLRGDGLLNALRAAFVEAGVTISALDYRITDANGEQYWFKEGTLALERYLRNRVDLFEIWHPIDCVAEVGAAIGPLAFAIALAATRKRYSYGRGPLCHFGSDDGTRIAVVLDASTPASNG
jgi:3-oxoacyl-[acyl-carrier-protein] synthase I